MKLSSRQADLFFELMWALQFFVNQKLGILPSVNTLKEYISCSMEEKLKVREELYKNEQLIDLFVKENPIKFSEDRLLIVSTWKDYVKGNFYIERFLKKHAIFISNENRVYGVCGLHQRFDEMIHPSRLPLFVQAVLLPFSDKVVYDGLFQAYDVHAGTGVRGHLKEIYMIAKQNNSIIERFELRPLLGQPEVQVLKDWESEIKVLCEKARGLKAGSKDPLIYGAAFGLVKASLESAQIVVSHSGDSNALHKSLKKVQRQLNKAYTVIRREQG